jgi:hypothetical protein
MPLNTIVFMKRVPLDAYICDTLMRDLVGHDRKPSAFILFLHLYCRTHARRLRTVSASYQELSEDTGLSRSAVQGAARLLLRRRLISVAKNSPTAVPEYRVNRDWKRLGP